MINSATSGFWTPHIASLMRATGLTRRALIIDQIVGGPKFHGWLSANASISRAKASGAVNATQCPASGRIVTCLLPNA